MNDTARTGTILEVALNGPWGRHKQPGIPVSVDEIVRDGVACARAGAAVLHVHPYDPATGRQRDELDIYLAIIEGIRSQCDVLVYPTAPFVDDDAADRYGVTSELARRGLIEWATVDPGSLNVVRYDELAAGQDGFVYRNPLHAARAGMQVAERHGIVPSYAIYEPGMARLGAALQALHPKAPAPIYRLMFSDEFTFGLPPTEASMAAYEGLFAAVAPKAHVMVAGLGVDVRGCIAGAVRRGWHLRVGLEDARFGIGRSNVSLVEEAVSMIVAAGGRPATPAQARALTRG